MSKNVYIHYGATEFDISKFKPIANQQPARVKPIGGLYASPKDSSVGWKDWCEYEDYKVNRLKTSFEFVLKDGSKVLEIRRKEELERLSEKYMLQKLYYGPFCLNFEEIAKDYDAIHIDGAEIFLYNALYGWDCDTLLVLNPECVEGV